jgi:hypothetical protein
MCWYMSVWQLRADLSLLKTFYGLLSLPFILFISPLAPLLLHLRPTGYDQAGGMRPLEDGRRRMMGVGERAVSGSDQGAKAKWA